MVKINGGSLTLATFCQEIRNLLGGLKNGMLAIERAGVNGSLKRKNNYRVNPLMHQTWESYKNILKAGLRLIPSTKPVEFSSRNKFPESKSLLCLSFSTVLAPRKIFKAENFKILIREVCFERGPRAQVIHKWNKRNAYPMPSPVTNWKRGR